MAITWATTITVKDTDTKECSIQSVRTDDSTTPNKIDTFGFSAIRLATQEDGDYAIDCIYKQYLREKEKQTKIDNILNTYQDYFNEQLEGKEV